MASAKRKLNHSLQRSASTLTSHSSISSQNNSDSYKSTFGRIWGSFRRSHSSTSVAEGFKNRAQQQQQHDQEHVPITVEIIKSLSDLDNSVVSFNHGTVETIPSEGDRWSRSPHIDVYDLRPPPANLNVIDAAETASVRTDPSLTLASVNSKNLRKSARSVKKSSQQQNGFGYNLSRSKSVCDFSAEFYDLSQQQRVQNQSNQSYDSDQQFSLASSNNGGGSHSQSSKVPRSRVVRNRTILGSFPLFYKLSQSLSSLNTKSEVSAITDNFAEIVSTCSGFAPDNLTNRFGGDPQKRNLMNRLGIQLAYNCIGANLTSIATLMLRFVYGALPVKLIEVTFFIANSVFVISSMFALDEMAILRFSSLFLWRGCPPLNEDFFSFFFYTANYVVAIFYAIWEKMGKRQSFEMYFILTGKPLLTNQFYPNLRFFGIPLLVTIVIYIIHGTTLHLYKLKTWFKERKAVHPVNLPPDPEPEVDHVNPGRYNNAGNNKDVTNHLINLIAVAFILSTYIIPIMLKWKDNVIQSVILSFMVPMCIMILVLPFKTLLQTPEIWNYVKTNYFEDVTAVQEECFTCK